MLVRTAGAGATHDFTNWLVGQRLSYSLGFTLPADIAEKLALILGQVWAPAYDAGLRRRPPSMEGRVGR